MTNIYFDTKNDILVWEFTETITKNDLFEALEKIKELSKIRNNIYIYCNTLNSKLDIEHSELTSFSKKIQSFIDLFDIIKLSVAVTEPKATAFFLMTFINITDFKFSGQVFSTEKAAIEWLKSS